MKTFLDCLPCMMSQALRAGRMATDDEKKLKKLLDSVGAMMKDIPMENTPPETGEAIYREVRKITGVTDPYNKIKESNIKQSLLLYPELKRIIRKSENKLLTAIRMAIAGNIIDYGVGKEFNIVEDVNEILKQEFAIFDFHEFKKHLKKAKTILYLGDNAGESVFDKILIEELNKDVIYVVRDIPVINDVTYQDAVDSGIDEVAEIISSGSSAPAVIPKLCNNDFLEKFNAADMIISKGQGNFEGLSNNNSIVFFLLKVKCHVIARHIKVREGDIVLKGINLN